MYTTLETSKKLKEWGCELESEMWWNTNDMEKKYENWELASIYEIDEFHYSEYAAFDLLWDICIKYSKEFFGKKSLKEFMEGTRQIIQEGIPAYKLHSKKILSLLQQGKQKEAEEYILANTILNPNNK